MRPLTRRHRDGPVAERPPRPAATIVVVRDGDAGIEVLLSRRAERGDHNSGAWVFPGGIVDRGDARRPRLLRRPRRRGSEPPTRPGQRRPRLLRRRRARMLRGIGAAVRASGGEALVDLDGVDAARLGPGAAPCIAASGAWPNLCAREGLRARRRSARLPESLADAARRAKRFDTRFFIAAAPPAQTAAHDGAELVEQLWIATGRRARAQRVAQAPDADAEVARARRPLRRRRRRRWPGPRRRARSALVMPRVANGRDGLRPVLPDEHGLGRARPHRSGRSRPRLLRHRRRPAGAAVGARDPRQRRQRQRHDRARHQHLSRRRPPTRRVGGDRSGAGARRARRRDRRRRARADRSHLRHPHAQRPLAGDARPEGAHRRDRARPRRRRIASGRTRPSPPT